MAGRRDGEDEVEPHQWIVLAALGFVGGTNNHMIL
jgi:hypothetical protein